MGGGLEVDLSHGAVAAFWQRRPSSAPAAHRWPPVVVLQVADVCAARHGSCLCPPAVQRYRLLLSDGVHSQPAMLLGSAPNRLVSDGALRRGSVVLVLRYARFYLRPRIISVSQLEVLQTECALIGSPKPCEPLRKSGGFTTRSMGHASRPGSEPHFGGEHIHPWAEPAVWKTVAQIEDEDLGYSYKPDFITVKAAISFVNTDNLCYPNCLLGVNRCPIHIQMCEFGVWQMQAPRHRV